MDTHSARENEPTPRFSLGRIVATPNALEQIPNDEILLALGRHSHGDWGELDAEDLKSNERALKLGGRLFSAYHSIQKTKFWIITEANRELTTILLHHDY